MAKKKKKTYIFSDNKVTAKEFRGLTPEQQQRILNDRRRRIKVVDAALPQEWYEKRVRSRFLRNPITPGATETGRELEARRKQLETLTFGDGDRQLADRERNQGDLEARADAWFRQYRDEVRGAANRAADASVAQAQAGQQMVQGVTNAANADRDRVAGLLRDQAAQLGQPSQEANFRQVADANIATRGAQMSSQAIAENAAADAAAKYAAARVEAAGLTELAERDANTRRRAAIGQDRKDYDAKKGAWREKFITDAISEARKQVLEDRLAVQQGLFKQAELDLKKRAQRETERNNRTQAEIDRARENRLANSGGSSGGGGKGKKPADKYKASNENLNRAVSTLISLKAKPNQIVKQSQKGARKGEWQKYGVEYYIRKILGENKTSNISREVAKRAIYLYIKYNGRVPGNMDIRKAPKSPPWR